MREIKFRGKNKYDGKWVYGYLVQGINSYIISKDDFDNAVVSVGGHMGTHSTVIDPLTVGQYTGLKDINGVEIYEGDVVKCLDSYDENYYESTIWFNDTAFCVDVSGCDYDFTTLGWALDNNDISNGDVEVIGNIHDKEDANGNS